MVYYQEVLTWILSKLLTFFYKLSFQGQCVFEEQQKLYQKFAGVYNELILSAIESCKQDPFNFFCQKLEEVVEDKEKAVLLDYGCGTGLVAHEYLIQQFGFKTIDGTEPCKDMLEVARRKGSMRNLYAIGSRDDHSQLPQKEYDVVFANGVFFVSLSHPDLSCISKLCNLVKKGGYIIINTSETYTKNLNMEPVEELERQGKLKILPNFYYEGYRKSTPEEVAEHGEYIKGVLFKFQVIC